MPAALLPRPSTTHDGGVRCYIRRGGQLIAVLRPLPHGAAPSAPDGGVHTDGALTSTYRRDFHGADRRQPPPEASRRYHHRIVRDSAPLRRSVKPFGDSTGGQALRSTAQLSYPRPVARNETKRVVPVGNDNPGVQKMVLEWSPLHRALASLPTRRRAHSCGGQ
jgi:hypothetical protein